MHKKLRFIPIVVLIGLLAVFGIILANRAQAASGELTATGTIETETVRVSPDTAGRVASVLVQEGQAVKSGDLLFTLQSDLLDAQVKSAQASLESAQAALAAARAQAVTASAAVDTATLQVESAQASVQAAGQAARDQEWRQKPPSGVDQPAWYFSQDEQLAGAQHEVDTARQDLQSAQDKLDRIISGEDLQDLQTRLIDAQAALAAAQAALDRAKSQSDTDLRDSAQRRYDDAKRDLDTAQSAWNNGLNSSTGQDIQDARTDLATAQARLDAAIDRRDALQAIADPLGVQIAQAGLDQSKDASAQADQAVIQAEKAVDQVQAQLDLLQVQESHLSIYAPADGAILTSSIHAGEVVVTGATAMTIGRLDELTITVYVPEDQYGSISVGQAATVTVDSFPGAGFSADVIQIADQAEFTPRNVQTVESRSTTVFAIKLSLTSGLDQLKPGMPADVTFH
jgi:HlyD family secretion protein